MKKTIPWNAGIYRTIRQMDWFVFLFLAGTTILALYIRFQMRTFQSGDYDYMLSRWYREIQQNGLGAIRSGASNYAPFYEYILYGMSVLFPGLTSLGAIKLPSIISDFVCAFFVYRIVRLRFNNPLVPAAAYFAVLFAPTMLMNSAMWGQADAMFTAGLLATIYFTLTNKDKWACICFGIAISIKLQAVFLLPFLVIMFVRGKISWKALLLIPAVYVLVFLPALILGRPISDLLDVYQRQVFLYQQLTMGAPNIYVWISDTYFDLMVPIGVTFTFSLCFILLALVYKSKIDLDPAVMVLLAFLSVILVPYFLPKMHERYFFAADVISILFVFYHPRYFYVAILVNLVSFFVYTPFLFHTPSLPAPFLSLGLLIIIMLLIRELINNIYPRKPILEERISE